jgi:hypothetical protein
MNLDAPLLQLSPHDYFTYRDAFNGVSVTSSIGGGELRELGKSPCPLLSACRHGRPVLYAKPEEAVLWRRYAAGLADRIADQLRPTIMASFSLNMGWPPRRRQSTARH